MTKHYMDLKIFAMESKGMAFVPKVLVDHFESLHEKLDESKGVELEKKPFPDLTLLFVLNS